MRTQPATKRRTKSGNQKFWLAHVNACQKSGLSRAEYCRQHNLSHHQLRYWHQKHEQSGQSETIFAPVPLARALTSYKHREWESALRVEVGGRFKVEVADDFSPLILAQLINTLEGC